VPGDVTILDWSTQDAFLVGPYRAPQAARITPFRVPAGKPEGFRVARIRSGPAWPASLPTLDRLAAVPRTNRQSTPRSSRRHG
jgi:hypothetical protein